MAGSFPHAASEGAPGERGTLESVTGICSQGRNPRGPRETELTEGRCASCPQQLGPSINSLPWESMHLKKAFLKNDFPFER